MFIYNVTVNIADDVHQEWLKWMKGTHIPDVMKTGCFIDNQMVKVLYVEDEGHTFSTQYKFLEMVDIEKYQKEFGEFAIIFCGGDANFFEKKIKFRIFAIPKLIHFGLNRILEYNVAIQNSN